MFDVLLAYFQRKFSLGDRDITLIRSIFLSKDLQKGEFLQREGDIPRYGAFVCKGFLRSYIIDEKGKEHIIQFAPENWWISSKAGAAPEEPTKIFIDAIEESSILLIDHPGHLILLEKIPGYANMFHSGIQKRGEAKEKRIVHSLSSSAEERYQDFLTNYPDMVQRIPQHMLASYLGITPETLSRIRRKALSKE